MSHPIYTDWAMRLNELGGRRQACFFLIDFEARHARIWTIDQLDPRHLQFNFCGRGNDLSMPLPPDTELIGTIQYADRKDYRQAFKVVAAGLARGDSYLTNLTMPVPLELRVSLYELYAAARADYRIWWKNRLACFSPETFVRIEPSGRIAGFPMKGTALDTDEGRQTLLESPKEIAEHATIVDLIRNDINQVAQQVQVDRYRYLQRIESPQGSLLQTSSEISGRLGPGWSDQLGSTLQAMLPAGSVSGAPKSATLDIIRRAEGRSRGFYCGIGGYFDGQSLDSCVLIRLVEQITEGRHQFWTGGGITARSHWEEEYRELCAKVRIPRRLPVD